jgi:hypothetical protein
MTVLQRLNDGIKSVEYIKKLKDEEQKMLEKYTKAKKSARTNWQAFCVFNFNKLKPKLVDAIQALHDDPNNPINEIDVNGVIDKLQVKEFKTSSIKFNTDEGTVSPLFKHSYKNIIFEYAAEIRSIYGIKDEYNNLDAYDETTVWGEPVLKEQD